MLINRREPEVETKLRAELSANPGLVAVLAAFELAPERFRIEVGAAGLEFAAEEPAWNGNALPATSPRRRCRMKLFRPREGRDRLCAFFYKRSNLSWSGDRFSYGGVEFLPEDFVDRDARGWIDWLVSGLDPARRPERLRRSFLYDIPD
ncbi:MAG: hypothetical protein ACRENN_00790 [Candidatus Eiseniibacteriota bacterium]